MLAAFYLCIQNTSSLSSAQAIVRSGLVWGTLNNSKLKTLQQEGSSLNVKKRALIEKYVFSYTK